MFNTFIHADWCGPNHPLAKEVAHFLASNSGSWLAHEEIATPGFEADLDYEKRLDPTLPARWQAFKALARYLATKDVSHLDTAIAAFDLALGASAMYDPPPRQNTLLHRASWTPGTYLVHDFLEERYRGSVPNPREDQRGQARSGSALEATPILATGEIANYDDCSGVLMLEVEALPGPPGLITPDFWSMGLVAFGSTAASPGKPSISFLALMHNAFRWTLVPSREVRLRWRLKPRTERFPTILLGRSAEVAAACCVQALMIRESEETPALLDPDVAVTACLGPEQGEKPDERPLCPVSEKTLENKYRVALRANLVAVLVSEGQDLPEKGVFEARSPLGGEVRTILVQAATTLGEAYNSLLVTPNEILLYKESICGEWKQKWQEEPTPGEYVAASQKPS